MKAGSIELNAPLRTLLGLHGSIFSLGPHIGCASVVYARLVVVWISARACTRIGSSHGVNWLVHRVVLVRLRPVKILPLRSISDCWTFKVLIEIDSVEWGGHELKR